jgi:putative transposase
MAGTAGLVFHVVNRGVKRSQIFDSPTDYYTFLSLLGAAQRRTSMSCLSYCLMPNHFHLVLRPDQDGQLSQFMFWLLTKHARVVHSRRGTRGTGHVYQGRFKSIPVASDPHFLRLCRYVEGNPLRAHLVDRAEQWSWSSLAQRNGLRRPVKLSDWPVAVPGDWNELVNVESQRETKEIRQSIQRNCPYGPAGWREQIASSLGLKGTIRPLGRPQSKPGIFS